MPQDKTSLTVGRESSPSISPSVAMAAKAVREALRSLESLAAFDHAHSSPELVADSLGPCQRPLFINGQPIRSQAILRQPRQILRHAYRCFQRSTGFGQPVCDAHSQSLFTRHAASGQDQIQGVTLPDKPWQADRAEIYKRHAESPAVHTEDSVPRGNAKIAPQCQLQASGYGMSFHRRQDRLREQHTGWTHRPVSLFRHPVSVARGYGLQVRPGAERSICARQDSDL